MALKAPAWVEKTGATPTLRGWEVNGELIKSERHTQAQLDEYWGAPSAPEVAPIMEMAPEDPAVEDVEVVDLSAMTKAQLVQFAEDCGVEIDPKATKAVIIDTIESA